MHSTLLSDCIVSVSNYDYLVWAGLLSIEVLCLLESRPWFQNPEHSRHDLMTKNPSSCVFDRGGEY